MIGNMEEAKKLLDKSLYQSIINDWMFYCKHKNNPEIISMKQYKDNIMSVLKQYKMEYEVMRFEMPDIDFEKHPFEKKSY